MEQTTDKIIGRAKPALIKAPERYGNLCIVPESPIVSSTQGQTRQATRLSAFQIHAVVAVIALLAFQASGAGNNAAQSPVLCFQGYTVAHEFLSQPKATLAYTNQFSAWVRKAPYEFRLEIVRLPQSSPVHFISKYHTWSLSNAVVCFDFRNAQYSFNAYREFLLDALNGDSAKTRSFPDEGNSNALSSERNAPAQTESSGTGRVVPGAVPVGRGAFSDVVWLAFCSAPFFATNSSSKCPPIGDRIEPDEPGPWIDGEVITVDRSSDDWAPVSVDFHNAGLYYYHAPPPMGAQPVPAQSENDSRWKRYAPPFDKGFLRASYRVVRFTDSGRGRIPREFLFEALLPDFSTGKPRLRYTVAGSVTNFFEAAAVPHGDSAERAPAAGVFLDFRVPLDDRGRPTQLKLAKGEVIPNAQTVLSSKNHRWQKARVARQNSEHHSERSYAPLIIFAAISVAALTLLLISTRNMEQSSRRHEKIPD
ncbi:MAG: hypothetical protein D6763_08280 [Alphaproteobacteria bacterium]|nr:MAG: hypothetical protein D6763_08280 [Alphaproteobacteria bacterium]